MFLIRVCMLALLILTVAKCFRPIRTVRAGEEVKVSPEVVIC